MNDEEFYAELKDIAARRAVAAHLVDTLAFVEEVADRLEDDPAFGEFVEAEFSGLGRRNRPFRIHGFTQLDESDGTVGLVIGRWSESETPDTLPAATVAQLASQLEVFVREAVDERLCERMAEANGAYEIAFLLQNSLPKISRIRLHVFSNQPLSQRFKEQQLEPIHEVAMELHVWDLRRLRSVYESSREREAVELDLAEFGTEGIGCMEAARSASLESYVCIIKATLLADMFERYGSRLLEGNVRSFLGMKGGVNKGIRRTIQDSPELFFAFNNGIAATAASVTLKTIDGRSYITGFVDLQIVNGGQTTAAILNARKKDRLSLDGVSVAMKLTVVEAAGATELIPKIAEYANTQNKIAVADFFANHPFHIKMEEISRRLAVPAPTSSRIRSKWFYERARGQYQNERLYLSESRKVNFDLEYPGTQVINKTDLAKYDSILNEKPHWASLGAQKNFVRFASSFEPKGGDLSPSDHWTEISPKFGDVYYQTMACIAILWRHSEKMVSAARADWYEGDFRIQIVAYALAMLVHGVRQGGNEINWESLWNTQEVSDDLAEALRKTAIIAQQVILNPPAGMTNNSEWAKKEGCWDKARAMAPAPGRSAAWVVSRDVARLQKVDARKQGKQDDAIGLQGSLLVLVKSGYWGALAAWPELGKTVTDTQRALVVRASTTAGFLKITTEKDWRRLAEIKGECEDAGFRHFAIG